MNTFFFKTSLLKILARQDIKGILSYLFFFSNLFQSALHNYIEMTFSVQCSQLLQGCSCRVVVVLGFKVRETWTFFFFNEKAKIK